MSKHVHAKIPVNLIAGPLGVGKTTTINHLLEHRPDGERWAVLVNEYGLVGLDAALIEGSDEPGGPEGVEIREVAGGCICCTAGFMFEMSLVLLLQRHPDRLLIEPTGLAALSGILDTLDRKGIREAVDVRSVVCLLDPAHLEESLLREEVQDQVEAADVMLASRVDLASTAQLEAFTSWADGLFPSKRFVGQVDQGRLPLALLDVVSDRDTAVPRAGHRHGTDHAHEHDHGHHEHDHHEHDHDHHDHDDPVEADELRCDATRPIVQRSHRSEVASTIGWICWHDLVFDADRSLQWMRELAKLPGARRVKAVLRTNDGWWGFNFADGIERMQPSGYRRDSRLELVIEGAAHPDDDVLERQLRACLLEPPDMPSP